MLESLYSKEDACKVIQQDLLLLGSCQSITEASGKGIPETPAHALLKIESRQGGILNASLSSSFVFYLPNTMVSACQNAKTCGPHVKPLSVHFHRH